TTSELSIVTASVPTCRIAANGTTELPPCPAKTRVLTLTFVGSSVRSETSPTFTPSFRLTTARWTNSLAFTLTPSRTARRPPSSPWRRHDPGRTRRRHPRQEPDAYSSPCGGRASEIPAHGAGWQSLTSPFRPGGGARRRESSFFLPCDAAAAAPP